MEPRRPNFGFEDYGTCWLLNFNAELIALQEKLNFFLIDILQRM
jgi:hypothetical protein